jgi:ABC-type transport system involved in cytochrome c biogenesis permease subunit
MKHGELIGVGIPKTWALITWLVFILSTFSFAKRLARAKAAALGSCGFFVIWICYLGVNFLGKVYIVMVGFIR